MSIDLTSRVQKYVNHATVAEAVGKDHYDLVQVKYDGWWARVTIEGTRAQIHSRQNQLKDEREVPMSPRLELIGEFLRGTNRSSGGASLADSGKDRVIVFDVIQAGDTRALMDQPYAERLEWLATYKGLLPEWCDLVPSFEPPMARRLWDREVMAGNAEGLVFRNSSDTYLDSTIGRIKRTFTHDYVVMGFEEGQGKRRGMAGKLICGLFVNGVLVEKVRVGGGFKDHEMRDQFANFAAYKGRVLEVMGWQMFETGAMRHPNAAKNPDGTVRWRDDKRPEECTWPV